MPDLVLVDLYSQREAVAQHVKGWDINKILDWMKQYGKVEKISSPDDDKRFAFHSIQGEQAAFRFDENDGLVVFHPR